MPSLYEVDVLPAQAREQPGLVREREEPTPGEADLGLGLHDVEDLLDLLPRRSGPSGLRS